MEYIVGKPLFKTAITKGIGYLLWAAFLFFFGYFEGLKIFAVVLALIVVIIVVPGIAYSRLMWKVDKQYLRCTYHDTMGDKIVSFYNHVFKSHNLEYQISILLEQIDYIKVTYVALPKAPYGNLGYDILFKVYTYDGSEFIFEALMTTDREAFNQAVEFMISQGIVFKDKYHILEELKKDVHISYYLEEVHKERLKNDKNFHPHF